MESEIQRFGTKKVTFWHTEVWGRYSKPRYCFGFKVKVLISGWEEAWGGVVRGPARLHHAAQGAERKARGCRWALRWL